MPNCLFCKKLTENPKFCCKSCSASYNNNQYPKRKKIKKKQVCLTCGKEITDRKQYCDEHNKQLVDWSKVTYDNIHCKREYQKNSRVRTLSRRLYVLSNLPQRCIICGYDKHFHVCHKIGISEHDKETPISVINRLDNLIALCPNHHWELDNGLLSLDFPEFDHLHS